MAVLSQDLVACAAPTPKLSERAGRPKPSRPSQEKLVLQDANRSVVLEFQRSELHTLSFAVNLPMRSVLSFQAVLIHPDLNGTRPDRPYS